MLLKHYILHCVLTPHPSPKICTNCHPVSTFHPLSPKTIYFEIFSLCFHDSTCNYRVFQNTVFIFQNQDCFELPSRILFIFCRLSQSQIQQNVLDKDRLLHTFSIFQLFGLDHLMWSVYEAYYMALLTDYRRLQT